MKNSSHEFTIRVRKRLKVVGWTERHLPLIFETMLFQYWIKNYFIGHVDRCVKVYLVKS